MHVSPFMSLQYYYQLRFTCPLTAIKFGHHEDSRESSVAYFEIQWKMKKLTLEQYRQQVERNSAANKQIKEEVLDWINQTEKQQENAGNKGVDEQELSSDSKETLSSSVCPLDFHVVLRSTAPRSFEISNFTTPLWDIPFNTIIVVWGIYWQAALIWIWNRLPYWSHPRDVAARWRKKQNKSTSQR
jgi:hypothetical protein